MPMTFGRNQVIDDCISLCVHKTCKHAGGGHLNGHHGYRSPNKCIFKLGERNSYDIGKKMGDK